MSGRVNVVLSDEIFKTVKALAQKERRSQSQTAAILIEEALLSRKLIKKSPDSSETENNEGDAA